MFTFFTTLLKCEVVDRHGNWVGHPYDFTSRLDEPYPILTSIIIKKGIFNRKYYRIPWDQLIQTPNGFQLKSRWGNIPSEKQYWKTGDRALRKNVLDQQVVDTFNRKIVRVNDVHFLKVDKTYHIAHVDMGFRGLLRRLGWDRVMDRIVRMFAPHAKCLTNKGFIAWKHIQPLSLEPTGNLKLNVSQKELRSIPPSDLSEMLMDIDPYQRAALFKTLDRQSQVDIITELELKWQKDLIESLDRQTAVDLFEEMPADEATDLLSELSKKDARIFLNMISPKKSREITELMQHESDSAGGLMTTEFVTLTGEMTVAEAIEQIRNHITEAETIYYAFVVNEDKKLVGMINFKKLLMNTPDTLIEDIMQIKPPFVEVDWSVKDVAEELDKYNYFAIPVIDEEGEIEGIITIDDVLSCVVDEAWG